MAIEFATLLILSSLYLFPSIAQSRRQIAVERENAELNPFSGPILVPTPPALPPHPGRPANCLVATVLYDSCDPKYPDADNKKGSSEERDFAPQSLSTGFMYDAAGCCLGFAVFTNDCRPAIRELSFAKQKLFSSLRNACLNPYN